MTLAPNTFLFMRVSGGSAGVQLGLSDVTWDRGATGAHLEDSQLAQQYQAPDFQSCFCSATRY